MSVKQTIFKVVAVVAICVLEVIAVGILVNQLGFSVNESRLILVGNYMLLNVGVILVIVNKIFNQEGQNENEK